MNTIAEIVQKLLTPAKHLYKEGISYHSYLTELTWLLFLKQIPTLPNQSEVPTHLNWDTLIQQQGLQQLKYYQEVIYELGHVSNPVIAGIYAHAQTTLKQPEQLTLIISALTAIDDIFMDEELGELYDLLLEEGARQEGCHLQIAPRSLIDLIVILIQPQAGELIQDPLAGAAHFIVAASQYIQITNEELKGRNDKSLPQSDFLAIEPDLMRHRLALMNCLLHQINSSQPLPIQWGDSLLSNQYVVPVADVILSMLIVVSDPKNDTGKPDTSLALLQHIYQSLKPGGRAAVILSDNVLRSAGPAQQVRKTLLDSCVLHTVLRLPHGIFYPYQVSAHVLFFRRGQSEHEKTEQVWFYDARTGFPTFGPYLRLTRAHLRSFEIVYGDDPLGQALRHDEGKDKRWRCFDRHALAKSGDRLDWCWLSDDETDLTDHVPSQDIWEVLDETVAELEFLTTLLRE